jgi:hypothetical protein
MTYGFDDSGRFAFFVADSEGSYAAWEAAMQAIMADPRYCGGMGLLADHRAQRSILREGIARRGIFIERNQGVLEGSRCAVVTSPGFNYGMARMAEVMMAGGKIEFGAFEDIDEARAWLTRD